MIFRQYLHTEPVAASYLFGCGGKGKGVVVDPLIQDVDFYVRQAAELGMQITYVFDTHLHADHVSGGRALAEKTGAQYVLHESAPVNFPFKGVADGDEVVAGNVVIRVLHTPGHTPEHISLVVTDKTRSNDPWFVLTGHTLMVGDVGRTELASEAEIGASDLYDSLFKKLLLLEDHIEVFPGAFSGSVCGRSLSGKPSSTIGFERRFNKALQETTKGDFVKYMLEEIPPKPEGFEIIRKTNMGYGG
ncbi:MAG: MBL fold metallo-hydrolase [Alicyclobacillus macrosporangiidus]|uniref:MBL fold metallo-hydrolase n=1 Tax=Alicyclobacillus macrosporangiidus TaxID=392015 RepID=UPI0026F01280|nr:MBL fold metallo-hydrolase [Alicyclobacillus macrosporangiidus]MCL6600845.1 MBL fold metallo-hydrolase [Alicyclobacillus macrosporangiidus]